MKKNLFLWTILLAYHVCSGQLAVNPGAYWVNNGSVVVTLHDMDLVNSGTIAAGNSLMKFTGSANKTIGGDSISLFHELELAKTGTATMTLLKNIAVGNRVLFTSGLLELNQRDLNLAGTAYLDNESENSRITGINGGEVITTASMNAPVGSNPGNLGALISSPANLGTVTLKRGHRNQSGSGLNSSIHRYYTIEPANNNALNATLRFHYFDAELNAQSENVLEMYKGNIAGTNWINQSYTSRNAASNYVERTGIQQFSRWTLSSTGGPLPVTGLEFFAKRISGSQVQLNWSTRQEFNNKGFYIERKKANENAFTSTCFVGSPAPGGNSHLPLNYSKIDINEFKGITYYRLRQEDFDGRFSYSVIRFVNGGDVVAGMRVWPVPSNGDANVLLMNIEKDVLQVFDMKGRLVQQFAVSNNVPQKISGLAKGTYVLRLAGNEGMSQKIIIQ
jgi:Secretion system C-terminal sorting domain